GKSPSRSMPAAPSDRSSSPTAPVEQPANTASRENSAARTQGSPRPVERVGDSATPAWVRTAGAVMGSPLRGIRLRLGLPHIRRNSIALTAVRASAPKRCRRPLAPHGDSYHPGVDKVRLALLRFAGTDIPEMAGAHVNDPLLTRHSRGAHASALAAATAEVGRYLDDRTTPRSPASPSLLSDATAAVDLDAPLGSLDLALDEVRGLYLDHAVGYHHPRYLAHLNCPVTIPALAAETLTTAAETPGETWEQGTSACLIEQRLIERVAGLVDCDGPSGVRPDGVFTPGGSASNLQGLFTAREDRLGRPGTGSRGERLSRLRILTGEHAHMSVAMAARLLGLPRDAVVPLPCVGDMLDPAALDRELEHAAACGDEIAAVVAVAGTTDHGAIDPLAEIGAVCRRHDVWLHVDAAYGGGLLVSPTRRDMLDGIGLADSVTVDFHKTFYL